MAGPATYFINEQFNYLAVAGNIGAGKTTLTQRLAEDLRIQPFFEPVKENPYLEDFYKDMKRWSFHLQVFFLNERFKAQAKIQKENIWCIQDRTIYEDIDVFARTQYLVNAMNDRDYQTYSTLASNIIPFLRLPKKMIYLKASVDKLVERIRERHRSYEQEIDVDYLTRLNTHYNQWVSKFSGITEIITVDIDKIDLSQDNGFYQKLVEDLSNLMEKNN